MRMLCRLARPVAEMLAGIAIGCAVWLAVFAVLWLCGVSPARGADDPESRARAALALASARPAPGDEKASCGHCRVDLDACRRDALARGKVVVLFVNVVACDGRGAADLGAIPCRVPSYTGDGRKSDEPRVVVLGPWPGETGMTIRATLPAAPGREVLTKAVKAASDLATLPPVESAKSKRLDWK